MLEYSIQRSSTDTSIHFVEAPWRLHELFAQDNKSPFCFPHSFPEVKDAILSWDKKPENTFTLVTLLRAWVQNSGASNALNSSKFPTSFVGQVVLSNCVSKTLTPLTTTKTWFLLQLIARHTCNQVICKGSLGTSMFSLKRRVSLT